MMQKHNNLASSLPTFRPDLKSRPTTRGQFCKSKKVTLLDALDRVIDKGAYVDGEIVLRIADIDLVFIGLRLMVTSISNAERLRGNGRMGTPSRPPEEDIACIRKLEEQLRDIENSIPKIIDAGNPEKAEQGIAKLVLTLVKLISQLLEREAVRRVDSGVLSETEIQKLGLTFKILEKKIQEMKTLFGIKDELNLDLGLLGRLL
ncbi:MAG: gas vesicle protein GvpJ [bacterium]